MTYPQTLQNVIAQQPYPLLFISLSGAHLYGFPSPDSDYDLRGAHILPLRDVIGLKTAKDAIHKTSYPEELEIDLVTHDVAMFATHLLKKSSNFLEQLYSPLVLYTTAEHDALRDIAKQTITVHHAHHYFGFSRKQWGDFVDKPPYRVKRLLYVFRVLLTGIHLMKTGEVNANLVELNTLYKLDYVPELIERKLSGDEKSVLDVNSHELEFYTSEYERLVTRLEEARDSSMLPEHPAGQDALNEWLIDVRLRYGQRTE